MVKTKAKKQSKDAAGEGADSQEGNKPADESLAAVLDLGVSSLSIMCIIFPHVGPLLMLYQLLKSQGSCVSSRT